MVVPIVFLLVFVGLVWFLQQRSIRTALDGVEYSREVSKILNAPDEEFTLTTTITNTKFKLVPFIEVEEEVSRERSNSFRTFLMPRSKYVRRVKGSLPERGRYLFSRAQINGGDFLGISQNIKPYRARCEIIIYPREIKCGHLDRMMGSFMGDISVQRFIAPDPILVMGFSEYTGREPMKAISWAQTLRSGQMMVKNYDYTTEPSTTVVLSLDFLTGHQLKLPPESAQLMETCLSIARTVCETLSNHKIRYDFFSNISPGDLANTWAYVPEGFGERHLANILTGLGNAMLFRSETLQQLTQRVAKKQMAHKSVLFIVPNQEEKNLQVIRQTAKELKSVRVIAADKTGGAV